MSEENAAMCVETVQQALEGRPVEQVLPDGRWIDVADLDPVIRDLILQNREDTIRELCLAGCTAAEIVDYLTTDAALPAWELDQPNEVAPDLVNEPHVEETDQ